MHSLDAELLRRARNGDEAAWHELVDQYGAFLYRVAFCLLGNAHDAEDVLQETFVGALRYLKDFEGRASVKTWLTGILIRQAARLYRTRTQDAASSLDSLTEKTRTNPIDMCLDVRAAIAALSPEHREVIVLRELLGMSYEEIAQVLSVPRGTVESRLFRARQILKRQLKDYLT